MGAVAVPAYKYFLHSMFWEYQSYRRDHNKRSLTRLVPSSASTIVRKVDAEERRATVPSTLTTKTTCRETATADRRGRGTSAPKAMTTTMKMKKAKETQAT